jgi:hypothetical protein
LKKLASFFFESVAKKKEAKKKPNGQLLEKASKTHRTLFLEIPAKLPMENPPRQIGAVKLSRAAS